MNEIRYMRAGWLIDGTGAAAKKDQVLSIQDGRFHRIERLTSDLKLPNHYLDLSTHTILPALVDSHVHLAFNGQPGSQGGIPYETVKKNIQRHLAIFFETGILAVRDGGDPNAYAQRYKFEVQAENDPQCQIRVPGNAWYKMGRYGGFIGNGVAGERELIYKIHNQILRDPAAIDHVKIINSGLNSLTEYGKETPSQFSVVCLKSACEKARFAGVPVMVHANGRNAVAAALAAGCSSIEHGYFMGQENMKRMADDQVTWVPTAVPIKYFTDVLPHDDIQADIAKRTLEEQLEQLQWARQFGVPVSLGTDAGCPGVAHGRSFLDEARLLATAGYRIEEIVQSASQTSAELLKLNSTGAIAPGWPATFLAVKASPENLIDGLQHIDLMVINGKTAKGNVADFFIDGCDLID